MRDHLRILVYLVIYNSGQVSLEHLLLSESIISGSYLRLIDSCITQLKAQGPSRTCNESEEDTRLGREVELEGLDERNESEVESRAEEQVVQPV